MVYSVSLHCVCHHVPPWTAPWPSPTLPALSFLSASHVPATCIVICYARPTTLTELLLLCACSSQAFRLSCSLSTCLLAIQLSFPLSLCLWLRSSMALLPPANRAEPGCGSIRPLVGASLRHCHLVNKSSANVTVVLACHISHFLPVVV